jgi:hypothetical protein
MKPNTHIHKYSLSKLVTECIGGIRIPMIQRDYAQGRPSWVNSRIRFLTNIRESLLPNGKPLHLDFVYGIQQTEDDVAAFCPLDGQQRLTTLFLLHWYLAARDDCFEDFQKSFLAASGIPRFSYQVRTGSRSFFVALIEHAPSASEIKSTKPTDWFRQQFWFRSIWERDPSVEGALVMLDAIHLHFKDHSKANFRNLMDDDRITFERLDLGAAGLHDDLYLRMNARGRPLTTFETFKARFEKHLESKPSHLAMCPIGSAREFSQNIDGKWLDFMWERYGPNVINTDDTSPIDVGFINLFRAVALVSLPTTKSEGGSVDTAVVSLSQSEPDYDDFENGNWQSDIFTSHLIHLLEALTGERSQLVLDMLGSPWFGTGSLLDRVLRSDSKQRNLTDYLQFAACVRFLSRHGNSLNDEKFALFQDWMRVIRNLIINSDVRIENFRQMLQGLDELLEGSVNIVGFLIGPARRFSGYNGEQTDEEQRKAQLIQADAAWKYRICAAERHEYFRGQIGFLLEFTGADPRAQDHTSAQNHFDTYLQSASEMFGPGGLRSKPDYLWERALLAIHDFFAGAGFRIWSFLENERGPAPAWNPTSWKRLLRDSGDRRSRLKTLWDRMAFESLEQIAGDLPAEPWRNALCSRADLWKYCGKRLVRYEERAGKEPQLYLLSAKRRRAAYAELFTYRLMKMEELEQHRSRFAPLEFVRLVDDTGSDDDPYLEFELQRNERIHTFMLHCQYTNDDGFSLWTAAKDLQPELLITMEKMGFILETHGTTEFRVLRQQPSDPLEGSAFMQTIADALRQASTLHPL